MLCIDLGKVRKGSAFSRCPGAPIPASKSACASVLVMHHRRVCDGQTEHFSTMPLQAQSWYLHEAPGQAYCTPALPFAVSRAHPVPCLRPCATGAHRFCHAGVVQWLEPSQTAGGVHPYLFTQCQVWYGSGLGLGSPSCTTGQMSSAFRAATLLSCATGQTSSAFRAISQSGHRPGEQRIQGDHRPVYACQVVVSCMPSCLAPMGGWQAPVIGPLLRTWDP